MPVQNNFNSPNTANLLDLPDKSGAHFFICFISSTDPTTKQSWCPDVRAALPYIEAAFSDSDGPDVKLVEVGQRPEWKAPGNFYRTNWNVHNVPTLARYERVHGVVTETGRLVEDEILVKEKLYSLINKSSK